MERAEQQQQLPRGGPVYLADVVGPLTRVPDFESSLVDELQSLRDLLDEDEDEEEDISVDDLKVFSEDELVHLALKQALLLPDSSNSNARRDLVDSGTTCRKRGRKFDRDTRSAQLDHPLFVQNVEILADIKRKQDHDKRSSTLHSFNPTHSNPKPNNNNNSIPKMTSLRYATAPPPPLKINISPNSNVPISYPHVLLCLEVYHCKKKWTKTQELLVLATQFLTEFRDHIHCSTDHLMQIAGQSDPSAFFLIEDLFCNDTRDPLAVDYTHPIFDWLTNSKQQVQDKWECILSGELHHKQRIFFGQAPAPHLPNFKAVDMHKLRFCDLWFRLGAGYLYCHQGDCKHTIVIRDMRLIHPQDVQNRAAYPIVTFQLKTVLPKCSVCKIYRATKVTLDDKWAEENPCYFCDNCYYLLHYDENGSLLYPDFAVYDYHHM